MEDTFDYLNGYDLASLAVFLLQALVVQAANTRLCNLLSPGSGWYTNVEMTERYASLVTPARWAFAIWGIIYMWELIGMAYLCAMSRLDTIDWASVQYYWFAANLLQAAWAILYSTACIRSSGVALTSIAVFLCLLGYMIRDASGLDYALLAFPIWLHAGWVSCAALVNINQTLCSCSAALQLAAASTSAFLAFGVTVDALYFAGAGALPMSLAVVWALFAIRYELLFPAMVQHSKAYAEIGEVRLAQMRSIRLIN
eukprot:6203245-Pleurochrysis_carterae.AAC.6